MRPVLLIDPIEVILELLLDIFFDIIQMDTVRDFDVVYLIELQDLPLQTISGDGLEELFLGLVELIRIMIMLFSLIFAGDPQRMVVAIDLQIVIRIGILQE